MGIYNWNTLQCITLQQIKRITMNCFYIYWQLSCQMKFESSALHFVLEYTHTQSISIPLIFFKLHIVTGFKKISWDVRVVDYLYLQSQPRCGKHTQQAIFLEYCFVRLFVPLPNGFILWDLAWRLTVGHSEHKERGHWLAVIPQQPSPPLFTPATETERDRAKCQLSTP